MNIGPDFRKETTDALRRARFCRPRKETSDEVRSDQRA